MSRPNILTFILDDTDFSMMSWSGGPRMLSPSIDSIARGGMIFDRFYVNSAVCTPGRYGYLTGKFSGRCCGPNFNKTPMDEAHSIAWNTDFDPERERSIAHMLQDAGYFTGHVGKYHTELNRKGLGIVDFEEDVNPYDPTIQGRLQANHDIMCKEMNRAGYDFADAVTFGNADDRPIKGLNQHNLEWICKGALDFLDASTKNDKPFHLHIATSTMHGPSHEAAIDADICLTGAGVVDGLEGIMAPRSSLRDRLKANGLPINHRTVGMLWTDDLVASVLNRLRNLGLDQNTLVIFSTDHNCFDGKASCYEGGVHVPFAIQWPGHVAAGSRCQQLCMNVDLLPTLSQIVGGTLPDQPCDGVDFSPWLFGKNEVKNRDLYFDYGYQRGLSDGRWKIVLTRIPQRHIETMKSGSTEVAINHLGKKGGNLVSKRYPHYWEPDQLYDLSLDPEERQNLAKSPLLAEKLAEMKARLAAVTESFERPFPIDDIDPFLESKSYQQLTHAADDNFDPTKWEWYAKGWY